MASSNVNVGIDAGTSTSKLAYSDNLSTRIIAQVEGLEMLILREAAEEFFDDMVFACVVAVPDSFTQIQRENLSVQAKNAGFRDVNIIGAHEALTLGLADDKIILVCDFGASKTDIVLIDGGEVLESAAILDVCGNEFDKVFAEYLRDRRLLNELDLREANRMKKFLSREASRTWHNMEILREDFEKLVYFSVKRASHTAHRLMRIFKPDKVILTGGCANIPLVRKIFANELKVSPEIDFNIIARGAALKALALNKASARRKETVNVSSNLNKIRSEILAIEDKLTRSQKDRLYLLFKQAEGINDAGIVALMENMIQEIRDA